MERLTPEKRRDQHHAFCRTAIVGKLTNRGLELATWFFTSAGRWKRAWTTREMARTIILPMGVCHEAMTAGRDAGIVRLSVDGWVWSGPPFSAVEIVPGHQTARFASERQEKRGLK